MNRLIETFSAFKIEENLPETWIKKVWNDSGFTRYVPFPPEYDIYLEEVNIADLVNDFYEGLRNWFHLSGVSLREILAKQNSVDGNNVMENEMNWQTLINEGIDHKPLICIIGSLILRFLDEPTNAVYFKEALFAIRLYSYILAIPGSHICQLFNSTLYSHVASVIKVCCEQIDNCTAIKNKGVKRKKNGNDDDMKSDEVDTDHMNFDKKTELIPLVSDFLTHLKLIFENKKLKMDVSTINITIEILLIITRLEKVFTALLVNCASNYPKHTVSYLAFRSFMLLLHMSNLLHSNPIESAKLIIKSMVQIFLITELRTLGLGVKDASIVRMNYIHFLKLLLDKLGGSSYEAVNILVQRICMAVPDRAEMRMKASSIVLDILKISPPDLQAEEIYSIVFMSHMAETKIRLFTLEIISKLLLETDNLSFTQLPQKYAAVTNTEFLLAVIFYRCQDYATSIRTKALSYLDQLISSTQTNKKAKTLVDKIFINPYVEVENPEIVDIYHKEIFDTQQFCLEERFLDDCSLNPLPGVKVILDMLVYFSQEDKAFIKKCAIQTLAKIFLFNRMWIKKELLQVFLIGCDDSSVLLRKTMCQILTDLLLMYPDHEDLTTCWVEGVIPMIAEEEIKAQEIVIEHICKVILYNIVPYQQTTSVVSRLPWLVMKEILHQDKRSFLHFSVGKWVQGNMVKGKTIQVIYSHIDTDNNDVAWCLLVSFSQFMNLPRPETVYNYYERIIPELDVIPHSQMVLETLYFVCSGMPKEAKTKLLSHLETNLVACTLPLKLIARSRDICEQIISLLSGEKTAHSKVMEWSTPKIKCCLQYIADQVGKTGPIEIQNSEMLLKYIFMLGEFAQAAPTSVTKNDMKLLENLLLSPKKRGAEAWQGRANNALKAITVLTIVKLVLQKEETANSVMPIFSEILSSNSVNPTIQVNTIIGMCDLCSRYTTLVERYFTSICNCFNSKHEMVRKTALVCVMKRVREEYVKLRPFILFPMLTMILDSSITIKRTIATFIMIDLKKKNNILETFYTGLFFFLNNSKEHSTTVKISEDLRATFSLAYKAEDREYIYIYVLDKLADINRRLVIFKKIINDIMASVADEVLPVNARTENILGDAFNILIDNEKKIFEAISKSKKCNIDDADNIEELKEASQPKRSSQGHGVVTITEGSRLNEANEILPVIMKLRLCLKKHNSKCLKNLVSFLCELMKNFRAEQMTDLLEGDGELKAEIEYNLRRMEQEEKERKRMKIVGTAEVADRSEVENRNIPVLTTSPEEICEQLKYLIVQLSRCDATLASTSEERVEFENVPASDIQQLVPNVQPTAAKEAGNIPYPIVKLTRCDSQLKEKTTHSSLKRSQSQFSSPSNTGSESQTRLERMDVIEKEISENSNRRMKSDSVSPIKKTESRIMQSPVRELTPPKEAKTYSKYAENEICEKVTRQRKSASVTLKNRTMSIREKPPSRKKISVGEPKTLGKNELKRSPKQKHGKEVRKELKHEKMRLVSEMNSDVEVEDIRKQTLKENDDNDVEMEENDTIVNIGIAEEKGPEEIGEEKFSSDED